MHMHTHANAHTHMHTCKHACTHTHAHTVISCPSCAHLDEVLASLVHLSHHKRLVEVPMPAVEVHRDVHVDDVPVLQGPSIRDAVADDLVHAGAHGAREGVVVEGGGVGTVLYCVLVHLGGEQNEQTRASVELRGEGQLTSATSTSCGVYHGDFMQLQGDFMQLPWGLHAATKGTSCSYHEDF
jgi:hypothetical protein